MCGNWHVRSSYLPGFLFYLDPWTLLLPKSSCETCQVIWLLTLNHLLEYHLTWCEMSFQRLHMICSFVTSLSSFLLLSLSLSCSFHFSHTTFLTFSWTSRYTTASGALHLQLPMHLQFAYAKQIISQLFVWLTPLPPSGFDWNITFTVKLNLCHRLQKLHSAPHYASFSASFSSTASDVLIFVFIVSFSPVEWG